MAVRRKPAAAEGAATINDILIRLVQQIGIDILLNVDGERDVTGRREREQIILLAGNKFVANRVY